jgi:hypothetical protein
MKSAALLGDSAAPDACGTSSPSDAGWAGGVAMSVMAPTLGAATDSAADGARAAAGQPQPSLDT